MTHQIEHEFELEEGSQNAHSGDDEDDYPTDDENGSSREDVIAGEEGQAVSRTYEVGSHCDEGNPYALN